MKKPEIKPYTRTEFCETFNVKKDTVRQYIHRGVLLESVKSGKKVIDIEQPHNKKYYYNYLEKNGIPLSDGDTSDRYASIDSISTETLKKRKLSKEVEKLEIQNAKARGELIPVEEVIPLFKQYTKLLSTSFHNATENIVITLQQKYKISDKSKVKIKSELIETINMATEKGIKETINQVDKLSDDYSEKRERGEHG